MPVPGSREGNPSPAGGQTGAPPPEASPTRPAAEHSDEEIFDLLTHVDPRADPRRYGVVRDEYVRRHGDHINGQPIDAYFNRARLGRPRGRRSQFTRRVLVALALWSLFMLMLRGLLYLRSHWQAP